MVLKQYQNNNMASTWDLIKAGQYERACEYADREFLESSSILPLRNKILALLILRRYADAEKTGEMIIQDSRDTDSDFIFLGLSRWLLGRHADAILTWKTGVNTKYTDAAGGVEMQLLLLFASISLNDDILNLEASKTLGKIYNPKKTKMWPGPIAGYVLRQINEVEFRSQISGQGLIHDKQLCQAAFYIGIMRFVHGDMQGFCEAIRESIGQGPSSFMKPEFFLAREANQTGGLKI